MTVLIPMTGAEFGAYQEQAAANYAADKVLSGAWTREEALGLAHEAFQTLLPQGTETPGHSLFAVMDENGQQRVGALWYAVEERAGMKTAYVYDIQVDALYQRQGHGSRAFRALEEIAAAQGLCGIALHVFGHNTAAQLFYATLGYQTTDITLYKALAS